MAPYQSLLPVRTHRPAPSGLPRPTLVAPAPNNSVPPQPRPRPVESSRPRTEPELSTLDFGALLRLPTEETHDGAFSLLNDEPAPDFLADQSIWTVGGRTPAKHRPTWDALDEHQDEDEDENRLASPPPPPLYDDSDLDVSPDRPRSTASFRGGPPQQSGALLDEQEPSMTGNYTSTSDRSQSFLRPAQLSREDQTFTLEPDSMAQRSTETSHSVGDQDENAVNGEEGKEDALVSDRDETSMDEIATRTGESAQTHYSDKEAELSGSNRCVMPEPAWEAIEVEEESSSAIRVDRLSPEADDLAPVGAVPAELGYSTLDPLDGRGREAEGVDEEELERPEEELISQREDASSPSEVEDGETASDVEMEIQVPVNFNDEDDLPRQQTPLAPAAEEEPEQLEGSQPREGSHSSLNDDQVSVVQGVQETVYSGPERDSSSIPAPRLSLDADNSRPLTAPAITKPTRRSRPSFTSTFTSSAHPSKRARHSLAATRPSHGLPEQRTDPRRRQSIATIKMSSLERDLGAPGGGGPVVHDEEDVVMNGKDRTPPPVASNDTLHFPILPTQPSNSRMHSDFGPSPELQIPVADTILSTALASQAPSTHLSRDNQPSRDHTPPTLCDDSLRHSPSARELSSLVGDTSLPLMGAPLEFCPSHQEIGHSTPAKLLPQSRLWASSSVAGSVGELNAARGARLVEVAFEAIEEAAEEEGSFEIVKETKVSGTAEMESVVKVEEEEDEEEDWVDEQPQRPRQEEEENELETDEQEASHGAEAVEFVSAPQCFKVVQRSATSPREESIARDDTSAVHQNGARNDTQNTSTLPLLVPEEATYMPVEDPREDVSNRASGRARFLSRPATKRSVRVSLAAPPPPTRVQTARRASTSVLKLSESTRPELSQLEKERKRVRVSLAAPLSRCEPSKRPRMSHPLPPIPLAVSPAEERAVTAPAVSPVPIVGDGRESHLESVISATQPVPTAVESESQVDSPVHPLVALSPGSPENPRDIAVQAPTSLPVEPVAPTTSPNLVSAPLPASTASGKAVALTLPTTFSFASTSTSLTREQERQKRKEERERREKRVEAALKVKKQSMQRGTGWKKPEAKKEREKRKAVEPERAAKRLRVATSENGSSSSRRQGRKATLSTGRNVTPPPLSQGVPPPRADESAVPQDTPDDPVAAEMSIENRSSSLALKLTESTLEANRVAAGPRIDLKRRISNFLESIEEPELSTSVTEAEPELSIHRIRDPDNLSALARPPSPPRPPPPAPPLPSSYPAVDARPPSRAESVRTKVNPARPVARAPIRKPITTTTTTTTTTTAKPFTFAAARRPPPPRATPATCAASPVFVERLSAWKAREREAAVKGTTTTRNGRPLRPMPFETKEKQKKEKKKNVEPRRNEPLCASSSAAAVTTTTAAARPLPRVMGTDETTTVAGGESARVVKRARVVVASKKGSEEQGRRGKENAEPRSNATRVGPPVVATAAARSKERAAAAVVVVVGDKATNITKASSRGGGGGGGGGKGGVAEEMEKRVKEKLEWSERQKRREEEVRRRKEAERAREAEQEREKLQALRASLNVDRGRPGPGSDCRISSRGSGEKRRAVTRV